MTQTPPSAPDEKPPAGLIWLQAFREVLDADDLTEDSDFFQAGGYSHLIPELVSRYEALSGWRPPIRMLFEFSSPRELEAETAAQRDEAAPAESKVVH